MVKWGIISDSHGRIGSASALVRALDGCEAIAYLGDGLNDAHRIAALTGLALYAVGGNCDSGDGRAPEELTLTVGGVKLLLAHGHRYAVKQSRLRLMLRAQEECAQVALYGHTHVPSVEFEGGVLLINPGALMDGRYAILEWREHGPVPVMKIL